MKSFISILILYFTFFSQSKTEAYNAFNNKNYEKAADLFDDIYDDDDDNLEALFHLGQSYYYLNDFEKAFEHFLELTDKEDKNADYYRWLLKTFNSYNKMQDYQTGKKIMNAFHKVVELDPDDIDGHRNLIYVLYNFPKHIGGDKTKSFKLLAEMEKTNPFEAKLLKFQLYLKSKDIKKALIIVDELEAFSNRKNEYYEVYNLLGYYYLENKNIKKALISFKKQIALAPNIANSYDSLGDAYRAAGDIDNAKLAYKKALELDPKLQTSIDNLKSLE